MRIGRDFHNIFLLFCTSILVQHFRENVNDIKPLCQREECDILSQFNVNYSFKI